MLSSAFVALLNHLLGRAEWARCRLVPFARRPAALVLGSTRIDFSIADDGYIAASGEAGFEPEVTISAPMSAFPGLIDGWDRVMKSVRINGNAEMADALGFVFRNLRWDPEADLADLVGDVVAHRLHDGTQRVMGAQLSAMRAAGGNLLEYLTVEKQVLLARERLAAHINDIRALRDAVGRLEKHVEQVERGAATLTR